MKFWTNRRTAHEAAPTRDHFTPADTRIYAIGDIHGRFDLLERLLERISTDAANHSAGRNLLICLGDYVDRGAQSREVIACLANGPLPGFETVCLRGNHEAALLEFLENPEFLTNWCGFGGRETLLSYGVAEELLAPDQTDLAAVSAAFAQCLPTDHLAFINALPNKAVFGDYVFVHAGLKPGVDISHQNEADLLWIRDEFLQFKGDFGKKVVHGHSPREHPEVHANRINVDTGAYYSNILTCVVLEDAAHRFVTSRAADPPA